MVAEEGSAAMVPIEAAGVGCAAPIGVIFALDWQCRVATSAAR